LFAPFFFLSFFRKKKSKINKIKKEEEEFQLNFSGNELIEAKILIFN